MLVVQGKIVVVLLEILVPLLGLRHGEWWNETALVDVLVL
jgi:hypothetical protein